MRVMRGIRVVKILVLALSITMVMPASLSTASENPLTTNHPRVFLVVVQGFTLSDLHDNRGAGLERLFRHGAAGLMSLGGCHRNPWQVAATLGSGFPVEAPVAGVPVFNSSERVSDDEAGEVYRGLTGWNPPDHGVIFPGWMQLLSANTGRSPGTLGEALHQGGYACAVFGNDDLPGQPSRAAVLIAVDAQGKVDFGDIGPEGLQRQTEGVLRWESDSNRIMTQLRQLPRETGLAVINFGDGARLEAVRSMAQPEVYQREKKRILAKLDSLLEELISQADGENTWIGLVGLRPGWLAESQQNLFAPVLVLGPGIEHGVLTSGTTRRPGLVADVDLAPSVLSWMGLPQTSGVLGRPWHSTAEISLDDLLVQNQTLAFIRRIRPNLIRSYILLLIITLGLALPAFYINGRFGRGCKLLLPWLLLFLANVPLTFLLLAQTPLASLAGYSIMTAALGILFALAGLRFFAGRLGPWLTAGSALVLTLLIDTITGCHLQHQALLSYDPMSGARYYGIGNEYMGVLIGAALLTGGVALELFHRWGPVLAGLAWTSSLLVLCAPGYGANVGGTIAAAAAFGLAAELLLNRHSPNLLKRWPAVAAGVTLIVVTAGWWDSQRAIEAQSHLGRAFSSMERGGWTGIAEIAMRKFATNLRLIRYTIWSRALLCGLGLLAVLLRYPVGRISGFRRDYPKLYLCLLAMIAGSFVALICNDSGIVAAATMMIYGLGPLLTLILDN